MATVKFAKVVSSLPAQLQPDTVYLVRTGAGFDMYVSDMTGSVAHPLNAASSGGGSGTALPTVLPPRNPLVAGDTYFTLDVTTNCRSLYDHIATGVELQLSDSLDFSTNLYTHSWPTNVGNTLAAGDIPVNYGQSLVYTRLRHKNYNNDWSGWSDVVGVYLAAGIQAPYVRLRVTQVTSQSAGYVVLSSMQIYDGLTRIYNFAPICGANACRTPGYALDDSVGYGSTAWGGPTAAVGEYIGWDFSTQNPIPSITKLRFWGGASYPLPEFALDTSTDGVTWTNVIPQLGCGGHNGTPSSWWVYDVVTGQITYE